MTPTAISGLANGAKQVKAASFRLTWPVSAVPVLPAISTPVAACRKAYAVPSGCCTTASIICLTLLATDEETGVFSCTCRFNFTADQAVTSFIFETKWEPTVDDPAAPQDAYWTIYGPDAKGDTTYTSGNCYDPCWGQANGTDYGPNARDFYAYVWLDSSWVVVQQQFTVYITLFYNGMPPEGWSFVGGDA